MTLKVCAVSGGRADWGLLTTPLAAIRDDNELELQLVVTGQHLAGHNSTSLDAIKAQGFNIDARVDMLLSADHPVAITKSTGLGMIGFADVFRDLQPDLVLVLGDRYEIMAAVQAAMIARIPIAHICGGDTTEGAIDEAIRHAITKMSHIHFVTNSDAERRVKQLGENPDYVFNVGSPGIDNIRLTETLRPDVLLPSIGLNKYDRNILVTFHPITLETDSEQQCTELVEALKKLGNDIGIIITGTNADTDGKGVDHIIQKFIQSQDNVIGVETLGAQRYFSALTYVDCVVGNSSSGLYEAPSFKIPTVNIGNRQGGRLKADSVLDCPPKCSAILATIEKALNFDCSSVSNPYGNGFASEKILKILKSIKNPRSLLVKKFFDV
ncbi:UDP-N-acetylglucosamine 2-epimerase [Terasakiella sp.]|uniref:UDP-N-acetylglucosamine 2-epimerase n=1 Tax=Terasakiella sp. TaxID=2034861 RepID=UPI003AA7DE88